MSLGHKTRIEIDHRRNEVASQGTVQLLNWLIKYSGFSSDKLRTSIGHDIVHGAAGAHR